MENLRECAGYFIFRSEQVEENLEIVIGYNSKAEQYVCWYCKNEDDYFWGDYSPRLEDALDSFNERTQRYS